MAEGTIDVSSDLQQRTDIKGSDQIIMVNPETKAVQYITAETLKGEVTTDLSKFEMYL